MRILVTAAPMLGHLLPVIPLAKALQDAGHEVTIVCGGDAATADTLGIVQHDALPGFRMSRVAIPVMLRRPLAGRREMQGRAGTDFVGPLFAAVTRRMLDTTLRVAEQTRPELILFEPLGTAGAVVAARRGVRAVLVENSLYDGPRLLSAVSAHLPAAPPEPAEVVTIAPPSVVGPRPGLPMRATPYSVGGAVPAHLLARGDRPRVIVSRSTVSGPAGGGDPAPAVIAAAPTVDAEFILVRGPRGPLPPNVLSVGPLPIDRVLPYADGFVHHGGAGSALGALAAGVPQIVVPGPGDRRFNAESVARRGAGLAIEAGAIDAADLRRLVTDPDLRTAAEQVRAELAARPSPAEVAAHLAS